MKPAYYFLAACMLMYATAAKAQYYYYNSRFYDSNTLWEIGAAAVGMNCLTDLGGKKPKGANFLKDVDWKNSRPGFSVLGKFLYNQSFGLRLQSTFGSIAAADSLLTNKSVAENRYERNLQFESKILEVLMVAELYPLTLLAAGDPPVRWLAPYFMAGLGYFHFDPVARNGAQRLKLQPLHTEGQGFPEYPERRPYALNQWNLPFGIGFRSEVSAVLVCGIEFLYRKLFTDYLDDVSTGYVDRMSFYRNLPTHQASLAAAMADPVRKGSTPHKAGDQRGNPANKDAYLSINLKAAFVIGRDRR